MVNLSAARMLAMQHRLVEDTSGQTKGNYKLAIGEEVLMDGRDDVTMAASTGPADWAATVQKDPEAKFSSEDERLIERCVHGDAEAWAALVNKYRNLIFSIPIKYGFSFDEASDIFQEV